MKELKFTLLDFDDTLALTNQHVIDCYNAITTDRLDASDFISEFCWDNLAYHKELWRGIIEAVVADPLKIPPVKGMVEYLNKLPVDENNVYYIVSKRYGKNLIKHYLMSHGVNIKLINNLQFILVSKNNEKIKFLHQLRERWFDRVKIHYYEDRSDVVSLALPLCDKIYVQKRYWNARLNKLGDPDLKIVFFDSYYELI